MSFWKNAFVFASGAVVGAAALTAFTSYQAFKLLKKNDTLYSAVEESVKAGVHTGGNELGNRLAKIVTDKIFDRPGHTSKNRVSYPDSPKAYPTFDLPVYQTRLEAENILSILTDFVKQYGFASVTDLYDASGLTTKDYSTRKYGWHNLDDAMVILTTRGYELVMPRIRPE